MTTARVGRPVVPLEDVTVIEFGGIGPGPFAGMVLSGMGATVHRVDRPASGGAGDGRALLGGRVIHTIDLKSAAGRRMAHELVESADALYETFRPGVMERLGLSPRECLRVNPQLVYAHMTGWGQEGPYSREPGHDINYLAVSGVLNTIGIEGERPVPPVNYVADYGAGGMLLVSGILAGLHRRERTGHGVVIDVAMVDGAAMMLADVMERIQAGNWVPARGMNEFDGGSPFYRTYETKDGRYMAVGAMEPKFYRNVLKVLGLAEVDPDRQYDRSTWADSAALFAKVFAQETQETWSQRFAGREACVSPVLDWDQIAADPHLESRGTVRRSADGRLVPSAAPRFYDPEGIRPPAPGDEAPFSNAEAR